MMCDSDLDVCHKLVAGRGEGTAIFAAHLGDESVMFAGQLVFAPNTLVIHATDGALPDDVYAKRRSFANGSAYRETRRQELEAVLRIADVTRYISFGIPDQKAALGLAFLATHLADACMENLIKVVFTHAYEGGHPDHDACAFAAHAAVQLANRAGYTLRVAEAPMYRPAYNNRGCVRQRFLPDSDAGLVETTLLPKQRILKHAMLMAYKSLGNALAHFHTTSESWRSAHPDFSKVPLFGLGPLYGESGLNEAQWLTLVRKACDELDIEPS